jgi:alpha-tubulin suppressor-like RCC1 family protein
MSIGNDEFGQLGLGARDMDEHGRSEEDTVMLKHTSRSRRHQKTKLFPRDVVWNSRTGGGIKRIFATAQTSFIQTRDKALYACGLNNFGQLGFGHTSVYPMRAFARVDALSQISTDSDEIVFITGGTVHSAARTASGAVYAWGRRDYSGMPANSAIPGGDIQPPTKLVGIKDVSYIACGGSHTIASDKKGQVYTWGFGGTHQLGNLPRDISMGAAGADEEPTDEQEPYLVQSKQLQDRFVVAVGAGAQHSVELGWTEGDYAEDMTERLTEAANAALRTPRSSAGKRKSIGVEGSAKRARKASPEVA